MDEFTGQNLNNLLAFLNRVQLSGEEATAMVELQQKIRLEMQRRTAAKTGNTPPVRGSDPSDPDPDPSGMNRPPHGRKTTTKKAAVKKATVKKPH